MMTIRSFSFQSIIILGTGPEKRIFDWRSSIENLLINRFLPQDFKNLIKKSLRSLCRELRRYLL